VFGRYPATVAGNATASAGEWVCAVAAVDKPMAAVGPGSTNPKAALIGRDASVAPPNLRRDLEGEIVAAGGRTRVDKRILRHPPSSEWVIPDDRLVEDSLQDVDTRHLVDLRPGIRNAPAGKDRGHVAVKVGKSELDAALILVDDRVDFKRCAHALFVGPAKRCSGGLRIRRANEV